MREKYAENVVFVGVVLFCFIEGDSFSNRISFVFWRVTRFSSRVSTALDLVSRAKNDRFASHL